MLLKGRTNWMYGSDCYRSAENDDGPQWSVCNIGTAAADCHPALVMYELAFSQRKLIMD
jgi:hypothetical protein